MTLDEMVKKLENHFHIAFDHKKDGFTHIEGGNWFKIMIKDKYETLNDYFDVSHWYSGSNRNGPWLDQLRNNAPKDDSLYSHLEVIVHHLLSRGRA
jgi:hypothetical protein